MPASHSLAAAPLAVLRALTEGTARLGRATRASAAVTRHACRRACRVRLGRDLARRRAVAPLRVGAADPGNYTVEWLLLGLALGVGALLHAELGSPLPLRLVHAAAAAAMRVGFDAAWASRAKAAWVPAAIPGTSNEDRSFHRVLKWPWSHARHSACMLVRLAAAWVITCPC